MAKKKAAKRKSKKVSRAKRTSKSSKAKSVSKTQGPTEKKFKLIRKNLILFAVLSILSSVLYYFSGTDEILSNFFWFLALIMGGITVAFVIAYLTLYFMKSLKIK